MSAEVRSAGGAHPDLLAVELSVFNSTLRVPMVRASPGLLPVGELSQEQLQRAVDTICLDLEASLTL